jgi:Rrf2 family protein
MAAKSRYEMGVHILILLAFEPEKMHTSHELAKDLKVNPVVVRRILSDLHKGGLIQSNKGPTGGSRLSRPAKAISLGDAYRALQPGPLFHAPDGAQPATLRLGTVLSRFFQSAQEALEEELGDVSLAQILKKLAKSAKKQPPVNL